MNNMSMLSYTSKDYSKIYEELKSAVPLVSKLWNTDSESDPGNVLIKLISMLGDMLSYNFDAQVLELFPNTVTQRKNARQVFSLIGYKAHWYRSAKCTIELTNTGSQDAIIPIYSTFSDDNNTITYTNIRQYTILGSSDTIRTSVDLIEGIPVTPTKLDSNAIAKYDIKWSDIYDFNVSSDAIVNNKLYFSNSNVEESTIRLIDEYGNEWTQVDNLEAQSKVDKIYEFKVDELDRPYIELCNYWQSYNCNNFKLFYILSSGEAGQISENTLTKVNSAIITKEFSDDNIITTSRVNDNIIIAECTASSDGHYPEEANEIRSASSNYINTYDTLVTLDDFSKVVRRLDGIANCIATDYTTDPYMVNDNIDNNEDPNKYSIKLYVVRSPEYEYGTDKDSFKSAIISYLHDKKMIPLNVDVDFDNIQRYTWTVNGVVYLNEPVDTDKASQILLNIDSTLRDTYNINNSEFNETVKYIDVVNKILSVDPIIKYVDLKNIDYSIGDTHNVPADEVIGKYTENIKDYDSSTGKYRITLENTPIKPGSVCIRYYNNIIIDNKNGKLSCNDTAFFKRGTVSYDTGEIEFSLYGSNIIADDLKVTYKKNTISIVEYIAYTTGNLKISEDNILTENYNWRYLNA